MFEKEQVRLPIPELSKDLIRGGIGAGALGFHNFDKCIAYRAGESFRWSSIKLESNSNLEFGVLVHVTNNCCFWDEKTENVNGMKKPKMNKADSVSFDKADMDNYKLVYHPAVIITIIVPLMLNQRSRSHIAQLVRSDFLSVNPTNENLRFRLCSVEVIVLSGCGEGNEETLDDVNRR